MLIFLLQLTPSIRYVTNVANRVSLKRLLCKLGTGLISFKLRKGFT